jgi:hypothetical protein
MQLYNFTQQLKPAWNKGKTLEKFVCDICGKQIGGRGNIVQHKKKHLSN